MEKPIGCHLRPFYWKHGFHLLQRVHIGNDDANKSFVGPAMVSPVSVCSQGKSSRGEKPKGIRTDDSPARLLLRAGNFSPALVFSMA
jgi:hypothetical protein